MPTTMPASITSRKTTISAATTIRSSLDDQIALCGFLVKLAEEFVTTWLLRLQVKNRLAVSRDHLLDAQHLAFKFLRRRISVFDRKLDRFSLRRAQFGGLETMVLDCDFQRNRFLRANICHCACQKQRSRSKSKEYFPITIFHVLALLQPRRDLDLGGGTPISQRRTKRL